MKAKWTKHKEGTRLEYPDGTIIAFFEKTDSMTLCFPTKKFTDAICKKKIGKKEYWSVTFTPDEVSLMLQAMLKRKED